MTMNPATIVQANDSYDWCHWVAGGCGARLVRGSDADGKPESCTYHVCASGAFIVVWAEASR